MKYILGQALTDINFKLTSLDTPLDIFEKYDFISFKILANLPAAIIAYIVYKAIYDKMLATFSKRVIENIIRKKMCFRGLLISHDVTESSFRGLYLQ